MPCDWAALVCGDRSKEEGAQKPLPAVHAQLMPTNMIEGQFEAMLAVLHDLVVGLLGRGDQPRSYCLHCMYVATWRGHACCSGQCRNAENWLC